MTIDTTYVPAQLRTREQWAVWGYRMRDGQQTKVPYDAKYEAKTT